MKVLHLRSSNFYGGPERQIHAHAKESLKQNLNLVVASFSEMGQTPEFIEKISTDNINTHVFRVTGPYDFDVINRMTSFLNHNAIDVICTHDYKSHIIAAIATRKSSTKWIAFSRGKTRENIKTILYQTLSSIAMRFCDRIVGVSNSEAQRLRRRLFARKKISVITNAILNAGEATGPQMKLRERFGFDKETIIVLSAGRFSPEKGQSYLIDAASKALEREPKLRFLLFGDGPDFLQIIEKVKNMSLESAVRCPGFEPNINGCLMDADIIVNPSVSEAMPNIILEAIALNKPIVATAVGGVPDIITDGINGILVEPQKASALSTAILNACSSHNKSNSASEQRQKRNQELLEELSIANQFKRLYAVYESELSR